MGVDIIWRNAKGIEIGSFGDAQNVLARAVDNAHTSQPLLKVLASIDTCGQGMIMTPQTSTLCAELEIIRDNLSDVDARSELSRLLLLVRSVESAPGSYLEYVGA